MKVLVISAAFPPLRAGEADYTLHLCRELAARNLDVEVITSVGNGIPSGDGISVYPVMRGWAWRDLPQLVGEIKRCRPDVILFHYLGWLYGRHPMVNFLPWIVKRWIGAGVPFVTLFFNSMGASSSGASFFSMTVHRLARLVAGRSNYHGFEFGGLLAHSDRLVVFSERHRDVLKGVCPEAERKIEVVPPFPILKVTARDQDGSLRKQARERLGVPPEAFLFVNFGYLYPGKGVDTLIQAFSRVAAQGKPCRLAIVGGKIDAGFSDWTSYADCLKNLAWSLGVDDKIIWAGGFDSNSDEPSLSLHAADASCLPFDVGLALNNSSAAAVAHHGLPIVSTRGDRVEPAFVPEENVLLSSPRDPEDLARAMLRVMEDGELRERLSRGASSLAQDFFSTEKAIDRIEHILATAAIRKSPAMQRAETFPQHS